MTINQFKFKILLLWRAVDPSASDSDAFESAQCDRCMVSDRFTFQIDHLLFSAHCELNRQLMEVFVQI